MRSHYVLASLLVAGLMVLFSLPSPADETASKEKIDKLIEQLGSGSFAEREKASKDLAAIGMPALEALRKAAKSEDAEIRKRAEDILPKIERQAESVRVLTPKRMTLTYKDTPLGEAVDDFHKKSGYNIQLHDPDGKLKERKITLDSGETTFWHALGLFCDKAELTEASLEDLMRVPQPPGGGLGAPAAGPFPGGAFVKGMGGMPGRFGLNGQLFLRDGKARALHTDDRSAVRIRVTGKPAPVLFGTIPDGEFGVTLEVSPEPKLQWQYYQSIHIDTAVDDQDQKLSQVIPQVEAVAGAGAGNPGIAVQGAVGGGVKFQQMQMIARQRMMWGGLNQQVPVQLKKGAKEAKSLKELKGTVTAQMLTEARPVITADNLDKAAGKSFKGDEGGEIKIVNVKTEENQTSIELQFEQPPFDKVMPAQGAVLQGVGVNNGAMIQGVIVPAPPAPAPAKKAVQPPAAPVGVRPVEKPPAPPQEKKPEQRPAERPVAPPPPPPPPPGVQQPAAKNPLPPAAQLQQIQIGGAAFGGIQLMDSMNGLGIQDDKGHSLPIDASRSRASLSLVQQGNGPPKQSMTWTLVCPHGKDKAKPAKVVFLGRKLVTVEIPFTLKDVPLP
ncbi:MAG TPA: hypothetical protein VH592_07340 [Gemmataceae bacterium]|jgi:hypothetical protein